MSPDGTETQIMPARYPNGDLASARTQTFAWDQPGPDQHGPDQHGPDQHGPDQHGPADTVRNTVRGAPADLGGDVPTARLRAPVILAGRTSPARPGRPRTQVTAGPGPAGPGPGAGG